MVSVTIRHDTIFTYQPSHTKAQSVPPRPIPSAIRRNIGISKSCSLAVEMIDDRIRGDLRRLRLRASSGRSKPRPYRWWNVPYYRNASAVTKSQTRTRDVLCEILDGPNRRGNEPSNGTIRHHHHMLSESSTKR
jgi:hypothetical protein